MKEELAVVFDWDGVVFNTDLLKKVSFRALQKIGCSVEVYEEAGRVAAGQGTGYTLRRHGRIMSKELACSASDIEEMIYEAIDRHPGTFVFPDAKRTLMSLKRQWHHIDVLTAGNREFQEYKIIRSELASLFRNIHVVRSGETTGQHKAKVLSKIVRTHRQVCFLDDRPQNIEAISKVPELKDKVLPILVWRKQEEPPRGPIAVKSLSWREIRKIAIHKGFGPY